MRRIAANFDGNATAKLSAKNPVFFGSMYQRHTKFNDLVNWWLDGGGGLFFKRSFILGDSIYQIIPFTRVSYY